MKTENEKVPLENKINGCNGSDETKPDECGSLVVSGENPASQAVDSFYEKLGKFYEYSGLCLVFNFRETSLDFYLFYKDVTERGGYYQVTKDGSWGEVASVLKVKSSVSISPTQLQKLYAHLLYQFEQTYYYRNPAKLIEAPDMQAAPIGRLSGIGDNSICSIGKRKHCDSSHFSTVQLDGPSGKRKCNSSPSKLSTVPRTGKKPLQLSSKVKEMTKDPDAPLGLRSAYQMFLKTECDRLKKTHGESSGGQVRKLAIDAWNHLSHSDRQPYFEASRKDRERFNQEMAAYKERKNNQNTEKQITASRTKPNVTYFTMTSQTDGDYKVTSQLDAENTVVSDKSMVELAVGLKTARPNDHIFQINWDEYCGSLDITS